MILHPFASDISAIPSPSQFTYPFCYEPHSLCILAADELKAYLRTRPEWSEELSRGKMFGVLVVRRGTERFFLAAFSGTLQGTNRHEWFVPPVYDLMEPGCHFQMEQKFITQLNHQIESLKCSIHSHLEENVQANKEIQVAKQRMNEAKVTRDRLRKSLPPSELSVREAEFIRESQFLKAEYKRIQRKWKDRLSEIEDADAPIIRQIEQLSSERQSRSQALQQWLFSQFSFLNASGQEKNLLQMFHPFAPPSGAGECCAPRLLQTAYGEGLTPLCMAEFWMGESPRHEIRHEGHFYPACRSRCFPILTHMLQGLNVEPNPIIRKCMELASQMHVLCETEEYVIVNKPSGMLSVPGNDELPSVLSEVKRLYPNAKGPMIVHRLDMDTSGLMLVALTERMYHSLQELFANREVHKMYLALLEHPMTEGAEGEICLHLRPDLQDRPRQLVDFKHGREAVTRYKVLKNANGRACVALYPLTGRTHQLRVHCAHIQGLGNPIVGDRLYGISGPRLMLHATRLQFLGQEIESPPDWEGL